MKSHTISRFWKCFEYVPAEIQKQSKEAFEMFSKDPFHPSLHFKRIHSSRPIYSARVSIDYRVIGVLDEDEIVWSWIGSHSDYDKLIKSLR